MTPTPPYSIMMKINDPYPTLFHEINCEYPKEQLCRTLTLKVCSEVKGTAW